MDCFSNTIPNEFINFSKNAAPKLRRDINCDVKYNEDKLEIRRRTIKNCKWT